MVAMTSAGRHGRVARPSADPVAGAVNVAAPDAAAGQHQAVAEVPVVAAPVPRSPAAIGRIRP